MTNSFSEDILVEQPAIAIFAALGRETASCWNGQGRSVYERAVVM